MSSPTRLKSPTVSKAKPSIPPGFLPSRKPQQTPIRDMTIRELKDLYQRNIKILSTPSGSSSSYIPRVVSEQAEIEARLVEIEGVDSIRKSLKLAQIKGENDMTVDPDPEPYVSPTVLAKRKALANFGFKPSKATAEPAAEGAVPLSFQEAIEIERLAHDRDKERQRRAMEKKQKQGIILDGEVLTREEREARIWAFMNHKPSESDLEDDDAETDSDDDPAGWFDDDQDDGLKGQDIVFPDAEELSQVIRMDESKISYNTFYEPHDDGD